MRLLLIEDNTPLRDAVSQFFREAGYLVDTSATGDEGLWAGEGDERNLIVADLMWSEIDDREVLRRLRAKDNPVDVYIGYLRNMFNVGDLLDLIHTRCGQGYQLEIPTP